MSSAIAFDVIMICNHQNIVNITQSFNVEIQKGVWSIILLTLPNNYLSQL